MPELPDVTIYLEALDARIRGARLERMRLANPFVLRSVDPSPTDVAGHTVIGLRRLGKEVYFITYNGDVHNPRKRANQKDVDMRMQQFFATKLKGEPPPEWMLRGIPYLEKGRDQIAPVKAVTSPAPVPGVPKPR